MEFLKKNSYHLALIIAGISTLGSLYFSEVVKAVPCILCWYQRIAMYPLTLVIGMGIILKDKKLPYYVLPLSIIGVLIAFYHYLLQLGVIPESAAPCVLGVSCASKYIVFLDFVTIPLLSLAAFALISALMLLCLQPPRK